MRLLLSLTLVVLFSLGSYSPPRQYYVDLPFESFEQLKQLHDSGFDVGGIDYEKNLITLVMWENELPRLGKRKVVSRRAIPYAPDLQYKKPDDIERFLIAAEENFPHLARTEIIGQSVEGRDIYAIQLTNRFFVPPTGEKLTVLFDSMHHAREIMTPEVTLDMIDYLTTNFESDTKVQKWLNNYEVWIVPMVNPDGNNRVWNASSMWRKNTRGGYGVDINRNYPHDWGTCNGSSGSQSSDTYRGPGPGSEPETKALMDLAGRIKPKFNISYHSFSEIIIYPYGCSPKRIPSPDRQIYEKVGQELGSVLVRDSGQGTYRAGTSYELLYNVDGGSLDWMYAQHKIMSFVVEVNSQSQGFQPSYQWRDITVQRQRKGWQYILDRMEGPGLPSRG